MSVNTKRICLDMIANEDGFEPLVSIKTDPCANFASDYSSAAG